MTPDGAISRYSYAELAAAGRRLAHRLRRIPATGIYGADCGHRTLWEEFCFETEHGPTPGLIAAWGETLSPQLEDIVKKLPDHVARLLSWYLASLEQEEPDGAIMPDLLKSAILNAGRMLAAG